jgi:hypothetical protein
MVLFPIIILPPFDNGKDKRLETGVKNAQCATRGCSMLVPLALSTVAKCKRMEEKGQSKESSVTKSLESVFQVSDTTVMCIRNGNAILGCAQSS